ncbi:putative thiopurine S-methyltransferase isoform X2 [Rhipicephalus microplus]
MPVTGNTQLSSHDYWLQRWTTKDSPWTRSGIHRLLQDNAAAVLDGKREGTVFLPMCGNAGEIKWCAKALRKILGHMFYDHGFRVVGVEFLETVARSFFATHNLRMFEGCSAVNGCKILHTQDLMLSIYICDLYTFNKECEGTMDIVWDRGGLVSIKEEDRERYVALLKSLLAPDFSYALYATEYEDTSFEGFPRNVSLPLIRELYGDNYKITRLGITFVERSYVRTKVVKETLWHLKKQSSQGSS